MEISGLIRINCPPDILVAALNDPRALLRLLPEGTPFSATGPGQFAFTIGKSFGPIRLNLPGTMTIAPKGAGHSQVMTVRAAHIVGGKVDLDLELQIEPANVGTRLTYSGTLGATGLAGRVLNENGDRANAAVKAGMTRLKLIAESRARNTA